MDQSPPSQDRLKRSALRAALWLATLIRLMPDGLRLPKAVRAYVERRLDLLAAFVIDFVIIRAAHHCRPGSRQRNLFAAGRAALRHDVRARITHNMRATIGSQLRRELKACGQDSKTLGAKYLKARAEAILHALENLDRLVTRFVRRMKKGLSRRVSRHSFAFRPCRTEAQRAKAGLAQIAFGEELRMAFDAAAPP